LKRSEQTQPHQRRRYALIKVPLPLHRKLAHVRPPILSNVKADRIEMSLALDASDDRRCNIASFVIGRGSDERASSSGSVDEDDGDEEAVQAMTPPLTR
jgi:hypothetical protein